MWEISTNNNNKSLPTGVQNSITGQKEGGAKHTRANAIPARKGERDFIGKSQKRRSKHS